MSCTLCQTWWYLSPFMFCHFSVASLRMPYCPWLQCFSCYFACMCFVCCYLWFYMVHTLKIHLLLWTYMCNLKCVYVTLCACVFKGEREQEGEGFYSPVFPCMWWYESQFALCVYACVCVWMNVDETEKAALCMAVHHRQYPCFSSIHIHTSFSYPLQEQGEKSANVFECTAKKDLIQKKNRGKKKGTRKS